MFAVVRYSVIIVVFVVLFWWLGYLGDTGSNYDVQGFQQLVVDSESVEDNEPTQKQLRSTNKVASDDANKEEKSTKADPLPMKPAKIVYPKSHGFGVDIFRVARFWKDSLLNDNRETIIRWQNGRWLYAEGVCEAQDFSCYFEKPNFGPKPQSVTDFVRGLTIPNEQFQKSIDEVPISSPENCGVIHVRHADITLNFGWGNSSETPLKRYIQLGEYLEKFRKVAPNVKNIVLLTDDQDVIDDVPNYDNKDGLKFHYLKRKRFRGAEGGWENHFPSGSRWDEMVTIFRTRKFVSNCSVWVGSKSSFADLMGEFMEPRPATYMLDNNVPPKKRKVEQQQR